MSETVRVKTSAGWREVEAESRIGRFAVTPNLDPYSGKPWAVTHIGTGFLMAGPCTLRRARSAARKFDALGDVWNTNRVTSVAKRLDKAPETHAKARAIREWAEA